ncbi:MAG: gamma-glutamylcyclotransferase family protein [Candidatus Nanoarchaeia archaeon]
MEKLNLITDEKILIFGYGSLLLESSLKKTAPNSRIVGEGLLNNFMRIFNKPSKNKTHLALNLIPKENCRVNGVLIELDKEDFYEMIQREFRYNIILVQIQVGSELMEAYTFSYSQENSLIFDLNDEFQLDYIKTCLDGARLRNQGFYEFFIKNTFISESENLENFRNGELI